IVLGWLGSGPSPARPLSRVPESHAAPTSPHRGACSVGSNTAAWAPPLGLTTIDRFALRVRAPLVPCTLNGKLPAAAAGEAATVRVLAVVPFAGGVTVAGLKAQLTPAGSPVQERSTASAKPLADWTVHVLVAAPPCCTPRPDGAHDTPKPAPAVAVGVASVHVPAGLKQAGDVPAATTL